MVVAIASLLHANISGHFSGVQLLGLVLPRETQVLDMEDPELYRRFTISMFASC